jgi:hypothetical protein
MIEAQSSTVQNMVIARSPWDFELIETCEIATALIRNHRQLNSRERTTFRPQRMLGLTCQIPADALI